MVNLTTEIKLGKQAVVYVPEFRMLPDSIKAYRIDVVSIDGLVAKVIDTSDGVEKTFHIPKILETMEPEISDSALELKLNTHKYNFFDTFKLNSSFELSKGFLFSKKCRGYFKGTNISLDIGGYPATFERDVNIFNLICAFVKHQEAFNLRDCKRFKKIADIVFGEQEYFSDDFSGDEKTEYLSLFRLEIQDTKDEIKEIKNDKSITVDEAKEELEPLINQLDVLEKKYEKAKRDMRGMLVRWFAYSFRDVHNSNYFLTLEKIYDVLDFLSIDGYKIWGFVPRQLTNPLEIKLALENLLSNR